MVSGPVGLAHDDAAFVRLALEDEVGNHGDARLLGGIEARTRLAVPAAASGIVLLVFAEIVSSSGPLLCPQFKEGQVANNPCPSKQASL